MENLQINLNKICRTCLRENVETRSIFEEIEVENEYFHVAEMLTKIALVEVSK